MDLVKYPIWNCPACKKDKMPPSQLNALLTKAEEKGLYICETCIQNLKKLREEGGPCMRF